MKSEPIGIGGVVTAIALIQKDKKLKLNDGIYKTDLTDYLMETYRVDKNRAESVINLAICGGILLEKDEELYVQGRSNKY